MTFLIAEETALKASLQGVTVSDEKQSSRPVKVWFGMPDVELRAQDYPYMVIDLVDIRQASDRQHSGIIVDDDSNGRLAKNPDHAFTYEVPVAYDLVYQITSYARHPRHDRAIITQILQDKFPGKFGFLEVPNHVGSDTGFRHMFLDGYIKRDMVEDGRRLFRNVFTVRIMSELDRAAVTEATKLVQQVNTNLDSGYDPSSQNTAQPN